MEFKIECPWCNQHYSVDDSFIGQNVECSVCGKQFTVRKTNDSSPLSFSTSINTNSSNATPFSRTAVATPSDNKTKDIPAYCPFCNAALVPRASFCSNCGRKVGVDCMDVESLNPEDFSQKTNSFSQNTKRQTDKSNGKKKRKKKVKTVIILVILFFMVLFFFGTLPPSGIPQKYAMAYRLFGITKADVEILEKQPSVKELKTTMPTSPVKVMVIVSLQDYYNYGYRYCKNSHYSIECSYLDRTNYVFGGEDFTRFGHGYVPRNTENGEKLFEKLKDGNSHIAIISIRYDYRSESKGDIFEICEVYEVR